MNQTGTRHYLECATNLQTRRLELCLITLLIIPDIEFAKIVVNKHISGLVLLLELFTLTKRYHCLRSGVSGTLEVLTAAY